MLHQGRWVYPPWSARQYPGSGPRHHAGQPLDARTARRCLEGCGRQASLARGGPGAGIDDDLQRTVSASQIQISVQQERPGRSDLPRQVPERDGGQPATLLGRVQHAGGGSAREPIVLGIRGGLGAFIDIPLVLSQRRETRSGSAQLHYWLGEQAEFGKGSYLVNCK